MDKIVIVVEGGMVQEVFGSVPPASVDVEVLDLDIQDLDELIVLNERLTNIRQHLTNLY